MTDKSPRVVVTSPRTQAARRRPSVTAGHHLDEQTSLGRTLLRSLVRAQLRLALRVLAVVAVLLGGLPVLLATWPAVGDVHVVGLPVAWLLLGVLAYPLLVLGGVLYVRQAERNEHDFSDLVDRS